MLYFKALHDFTCPATQSQYVAGLTYKIKPGNKALVGRVKKWSETGKVVLLDKPTANINGKGK